MRLPALLLISVLTVTAITPAFAATTRPPRYLREQAAAQKKVSSSSRSPVLRKGPIQRALRRQVEQEWKNRAAGKRSSNSSSSFSLPAGTFQYHPFRDDFLGNGQEALLYFYSPRSRVCQGYDKILKGWSVAKPFQIPLYRVEYDEHLDIRTKFGVRQSNSFLLVNGKGEKVEYYKTLFEAKVRSILYKE